MIKRLYPIHVIYALILLVGLACQKVPEQSYSESEKQLIKDFSKELTKNLQEGNYPFIDKHWSRTGFRQNIKNLTNAEESLLNKSYNNGLSQEIYYRNVDFINKLKFNNGSLSLTKITFYPDYAQITFGSRTGSNISFWRYKVVILDNVPSLIDIYMFKESQWLSQNTVKLIGANVEHKWKTAARTTYDYTISGYKSAIFRKDTLAALENLYNIPKDFQVSSHFSISRILLARGIYDDKDFKKALDYEYLNYRSMYINYLYSYYLNDRHNLNIVLSKLEKKVGSNSYIDSLKTYRYVWY